jgi:hypothetical protein
MRRPAYVSLWKFYKIDIDFELHEASILIIIQEIGFDKRNSRRDGWWEVTGRSRPTPASSAASARRHARSIFRSGIPWRR